MITLAHMVKPEWTVKRTRKPNGPVIFVRCSEKEHGAWSRLAARHGKSLAELVRTLLREEAAYQADVRRMKKP